MPRFVILEHDHPVPHWDLMLEVGPALKTWRLAKPPQTKGENIEAIPLADHRLTYLHYEGPVSGKRGTVTRWDVGNYVSLAKEAGQTFPIVLEGERIHGAALMVPQASGWVFRIDDEK